MAFALIAAGGVETCMAGSIAVRCDLYAEGTGLQRRCEWLSGQVQWNAVIDRSGHLSRYRRILKAARLASIHGEAPPREWCLRSRAVEFLAVGDVDAEGAAAC
ncbi:hypothetical protein ABIA13_006272 [Sinorhizobium fredii]